MKSDSQLQSDVQAELEWQPSVNAAHIGVAPKDGVVTLTGQVAHYTEKTSAEDAAKGVYGVKAVANDIEVELPGSSRRTDADVAAAALSALKWDFEVPKDKVKVTVQEGWVTLEGTVD
jgi:osmotically-inducible protein OsmY